ncbi:MAG: hypothetical protein HYX94_05810 [Chloroflexi bacterium]|nr:hypothetical protein [Chloroflexota bacterium]
MNIAPLIWTVIILLALAWFFGVFAVNIGWWINVLLALAILGIIYQLVVAPMLLTRPHPDVHGRDVHDHDVHEP